MKNNRVWLLILVIAAGAVVGALIADVSQSVPFLSWLSYSRQLGISAAQPMVINLIVFNLTFGLSINLSVASIICIAGFLGLYKIWA